MAAQVPGRHRASATPSACPAGSRPAAAQPPDRRPERHRRRDPRRPAATAAATPCIGINPATDNRRASSADCCSCSTSSSARYEIPTQSCVLAHVTTTLEADRAGRAGRPGLPVDRRHRGGQPQLRRRPRAAREARDAGAVAAAAARVGDNVMYFETGQGTALSADAHHGVDQQTLRGARLRRRPRLRAAAGQHRRRLHRARNTSTTASRSSAPGWRTISAASCSACRWASTSATPTTPRPTRTTWTRC